MQWLAFALGMVLAAGTAAATMAGRAIMESSQRESIFLQGRFWGGPAAGSAQLGCRFPHRC